MAKGTKFPILRSPYWRFMQACGELSTKDAKLLSNLAAATGDGITAIACDAGVNEYISIRGSKNDGASKKHLHIDIATERYFTKPPKASNAKEVRDVIRLLSGQKVEVQVRAGFEVPVSDLPRTGMVRNIVATTVSEGVPVKLTFSRWEIGTGSDKMIVELLDKGKNVRAVIEIIVKTKIDENYLRRLSDEAFDAFESVLMESMD